MGSLQRIADALARVGVAPGDPDRLRAQKATMTIATVTIIVLAVIWVATYLVLGLPRSALIPFAYQVISVVTLVIFARTRRLGFFRDSQLLLMLILPFLLQWSIGGYVASSAVSLWALVAPFGALFILAPRQAVPWFVGFVALTVVSGLIDPALARQAADIPAPIRTSFFVLNIIGVSLTAYLLLQFAVRARDRALASAEVLLLNVLPASIAEQLRRAPGVIADRHDDVTVLFADVVDFTTFSDRTTPEHLVQVLDEVFSAFDALAERYGLEKIKTIGDAYMAVAGVPTPRADHVAAAADMAIAMRDTLRALCTDLGLDIHLRIGLHAGPVVAGVIGRRRFIYDLWGDTVNVASRMESASLPDRIQVTGAVRDRLDDAFVFEPRGEIEVKGKGRLETYFLEHRLGAADEPRPGP